MVKNSSSLKWVFRVSKKSLLYVALLALLSLFMSFVSVRFALVSKDVIDIATGASQGRLVDAVAFLVFYIFLQILIHIIYTVTEVSVSCKLTNNIQKSVFYEACKRDYLSLGSYHTGELVNRITADSKIVSDGVMYLIPTSVLLASQVVFSFYELVKLDAQLAVICLLAFPLVTVAVRFYGIRMKPLNKACMSSDGKVKSFIQDVFQNILVVKAFLKEDLCTNRFSQIQKENFSLKFKRGLISIFANLLFFVVMSFAYYFALIWCAHKISIGIMTVGMLTAILQLVGVLQEPFKKFSAVIAGYYSMTASAERLTEIENLIPDASCSENTNQNISSLCFNNLSFAYENDMIFSEMSACISRGDMVAITGASGIGKSTLLKLMLGVLRPSSGSMKVNFEDGSCGDLPLRNLFSYVPQGNMLFAGTILDNIAFFEEKPDLNKAIQSAGCACIHEFIETLDDGYNTVLGEDGAGLSEGQIQRIAIARAIYSDKHIMLLDEATSALDSCIEAEILSNIKALTDKTCFIITHRPCALELSDREIHFNDNGVVIK